MYWRIALFVLGLSAAHAETRLIVLHTVDRHEVTVNVAQVTNLRGKLDDNATNKLFTEEVECVIGLTDGRYVTVVETCEAVRKMIEPQRKEDR